MSLPRQAVLSPIFAIGTGRCGTHLLQSIFEQSDRIRSTHIRELVVDSFYRYARWYGLPIDVEPLLAERQRLVEEVVNEESIYFEANPYLSFHIKDLYERFNARFIFIYRNVEDVVRSHYVKGWYDHPYVQMNFNKAVGLQYGVQYNHLLGRITPREMKDREVWEKYTRAGKIAWMWNSVNLEIVSQLSSLPLSHSFFVKIEDFNFDLFGRLVQHFEIPIDISKGTFDKIVFSKPGKGKSKYRSEWHLKERDEIIEISKPARIQLGY